MRPTHKKMQSYEQADVIQYLSKCRFSTPLFLAHTETSPRAMEEITLIHVPAKRTNKTTTRKEQRISLCRRARGEVGNFKLGEKG